MSDTLTFHPVGSARVRALPAIAGQPPRYIGRLPDGTPTGEPGSVHTSTPLLSDIIRAARDGHLVPADEATAARCGLPWSAPVSE